jgi:hypothetical protein
MGHILGKEIKQYGLMNFNVMEQKYRSTNVANTGDFGARITVGLQKMPE